MLRENPLKARIQSAVPHIIVTIYGTMHYYRTEHRTYPYTAPRQLYSRSENGWPLKKIRVNLLSCFSCAKLRRCGRQCTADLPYVKIRTKLGLGLFDGMSRPIRGIMLQELRVHGVKLKKN